MFILDYSGQDYAVLPDEAILDALSYVSITSTDKFFSVSEDGTTEELNLNNLVSPLDVWEDEDNIMRITTYVSQGAATANGTPNTLSAVAQWLDFPFLRLTDTFAIAYGGAYDDSYPIVATFRQRQNCTYCEEESSLITEERYGKVGSSTQNTISPDSEYLELDFSQSHAIGVKCDLQDACCEHTENYMITNYGYTTEIRAYLHFKVLVNEVSQAAAAYAHTTIGFDVDISATIDFAGNIAVAFTPDIFTTYTPYHAAPVTLRIA